MLVISAPGTRCPKEGKPRDYITDAAAVEVPDTAYYRRLINDGSLHPATGTPHQEPGTPQPASGTRQQAPGTRQQAPGKGGE